MAGKGHHGAHVFWGTPHVGKIYGKIVETSLSIQTLSGPAYGKASLGSKTKLLSMFNYEWWSIKWRTPLHPWNLTWPRAKWPSQKQGILFQPSLLQRFSLLIFGREVLGMYIWKPYTNFFVPRKKPYPIPLCTPLLWCSGPWVLDTMQELVPKLFT